MIEVPRKTTPVDLSALAAALTRQLDPYDPTLATSLLALIAVETARGSKMNNWNVGNLSASGSYQGEVWRPSWYVVTESSSQRDLDLHAKMLAGQAPSAFRSYVSLNEGLADYLRLLQTSRYQHLWRAMAQGDDASIVAELKASGYSPDYGPAHVATFRSLRSDIEQAGYFKGEATAAGSRGLVIGAAILIGAGLALHALSEGKMPTREKLKTLFG